MLGIYFIFTIILLFSFLVIKLIVKNKKELSMMASMTVSMGLGMSASLLSGLLIGILLQGDLYLSTVLSIIVGILIGIICGMFISMPASIEGGLSGLMGGMMGAMLGEMIRSEHHEMILRFMFILFVCTSILLVIVIMNDLKTVRERSMENHPLNTVLILASLTLGIQLFINFLPPIHQGQMHTLDQVTIDVDNFTLDSDRSTLQKGISYTLKIRNKSHSEHKITLIPKHPTGNGEVLFSENLTHGSDLTFQIPKLSQGEYIIYCALPGHREKGMENHLIVS